MRKVQERNREGPASIIHLLCAVLAMRGPHGLCHLVLTTSLQVDIIVAIHSFIHSPCARPADSGTGPHTRGREEKQEAVGTHDRRAARSRGPAEGEGQAQRAEGHGQVTQLREAEPGRKPGFVGHAACVPHALAGQTPPRECISLGYGL